jgi:hypothetical protein
MVEPFGGAADFVFREGHVRPRSAKRMWSELINMLRVSGQTDLMLAAPQNFFSLDRRLAMVDD